jgi:hypothetical protein
MLLSKLTLGTAMPLTRLVEALPMWPGLAAASGLPYLSLVPYPNHSTG